MGYSIELEAVGPQRDNDRGANWRLSAVLGGTPGVVQGGRGFVRGDANDDGLVDLSDATGILLWAFFGERKARGFKRDADPWKTRASIIEQLSGTLRFAPSSRLSREEVLRNDHGFEAVLSAYTAYLWARDDWQIPERDRDVFEQDGWIWAPTGPH